jgi:hypothetical protein
VIEALAPKAPDPPFDIAVLPWGPERSPFRLETNAVHTVLEAGPVDLVVVADEELGRASTGTLRSSVGLSMQLSGAV